MFTCEDIEFNEKIVHIAKTFSETSNVTKMRELVGNMKNYYPKLEFNESDIKNETIELHDKHFWAKLSKTHDENRKRNEEHSKSKQLNF